MQKNILRGGSMKPKISENEEHQLELGKVLLDTLYLWSVSIPEKEMDEKRVKPINTVHQSGWNRPLESIA